ncbi:MAG: mechanosensitive ion channel [Burkholderiales bacterium]|nr:mechanosensitive ion channel [Burkholderiales bacterium]
MQQLLQELTPARAATEIAVIAGCIAVAYGLTWQLRGRRRDPGSLWFGRHLFDGVLMPLFALLAAVIARWALRNVLPAALLQLAVPVFASLLLIRLSVQVLRRTFPHSLVVRRVERSFSWLVWIGLVLWLTGALPLLMEELESIRWRIGGADLTLAALLQGATSALAVLLLVLWLSSAIEAQLLRGAGGAQLSARKIAANATRALLLLVGILLALSAAGIPLSALSVMGGAIGVGIGLGLQKLAANYVSGFVILAEQSLRIGDLVKVDSFEGHITDIKTRYTVIRALNGRESIVPNELLITQRIENSSLADKQMLLSTVVQVAYGSDLKTLLPALEAAVHAVPRVMRDPGVGVRLTGFAADGLELTVFFWIEDPENGQANVRSDVNLAILATIDALGVEIPFPQRVVRNVALPGAAPAGGPPAEDS